MMKLSLGIAVALLARVLPIASRKLVLLAAAAVSLALGAAASGTTNMASAAAGASGMTLVGNADKDGTVNSDLAFNGNLAYAGSYDGFRILDIAGNQPETVVDFPCRGPQGDVSFHKMAGKTFLLLSIDTPQIREDCSSADAPLVNGGRVGFEGVRVFDVTNPAAPQFIDMIQTACGSHTHTLVPDGERAIIYVSSFPLGPGITPPGADTSPFGPDYRACTVPHKKISIIEVSAPGGTFNFSLREKALSDDTAFSNDFQACHDIQVFMPTKIAVAGCAGDPSSGTSPIPRIRPCRTGSRTRTSTAPQRPTSSSSSPAASSAGMARGSP